MDLNKTYLGDSLEIIKTFPDGCIDCVVTSPPYYGLRDYGVDGQIGLEETPGDYIQRLVELFREIRRCLKDDGTIWVNLGDSYAHTGFAGSGGISKVQCGNPGSYFKTEKRFDFGCKPKDLVGIPWMFAFAMRDDGWFLRQDIIWHKTNPMPESVTDRCTKSHEYIFLLSKSEKYYFDSEAIQEDADPEYAIRYKYIFNSGEKEKAGGGRPGSVSNTEGFKTYNGKRNKRDVWSVRVKPIKEAHFATYPQDLIVPCILAGCREGGGGFRSVHGEWNNRNCCQETQQELCRM